MEATLTQINDIQLGLIFHALADKTRRQIMQLIVEKSLTVTEIASHFSISFNGVSKHLKVLEKAKLLKRTKEGRTYHCQTQTKALAEAHDFLGFYEKFWNDNLNNLENYFKNK